MTLLGYLLAALILASVVLLAVDVHDRLRRRRRDHEYRRVTLSARLKLPEEPLARVAYLARSIVD